MAGSVVLQTMSLLYGYLAILFMDFLPMCVAMQITTMFKVRGNKYYFNDFLGMFFPSEQLSNEHLQEHVSDKCSFNCVRTTKSILQVEPMVN